MTTKENSIINSKLLEYFTPEYLKEHQELIHFVKKETEKQLYIGSVRPSIGTTYSMVLNGKRIFGTVESHKRDTFKLLVKWILGITTV